MEALAPILGPILEKLPGIIRLLVGYSPKLLSILKIIWNTVVKILGNKDVQKIIAFIVGFIVTKFSFDWFYGDGPNAEQVELWVQDYY